MMTLRMLVLSAHLLVVLHAHGLVKAIPLPSGLKNARGTPPEKIGYNQHAAASNALPKSIKLFGQTIPVSTVVQGGTSHHEASAPLSAGITAQQRITKQYETLKWLGKYVDAEDVDKYDRLLKRLKIEENKEVRRKFITELDQSERQAIKNQDEEGIKNLIHFRGHLAFFAPNEFPEHFRPDERRIEKAQQRSKARNRVSGRNKIGWFNEHEDEEAERIRNLAAQLHGKGKFHFRLNDYIRRLSAEERVQALQGDESARIKLSPKLRPRKPPLKTTKSKPLPGGNV